MKRTWGNSAARGIVETLQTRDTTIEDLVGNAWQRSIRGKVREIVAFNLTLTKMGWYRGTWCVIVFRLDNRNCYHARSFLNCWPTLAKRFFATQRKRERERVRKSGGGRKERRRDSIYKVSLYTDFARVIGYDGTSQKFKVFLLKLTDISPRKYKALKVFSSTNFYIYITLFTYGEKLK